MTVAVVVLSAVGMFFVVSGAVGVVRLPDIYTRLQSSTVSAVLGTVPLLVAIAVAKGPWSTYGSRALIVAVLLAVLNPLASHALARAAYKTEVPMWSGAVVDEPRSDRATDER